MSQPKVFVVSDTHFYHANVIKYCNRPYSDVIQMNKDIVKKWNSIVGKEDFGTNTKINIYVCCYDSKTDTFKMFNQTRNKYFDVCFGTRFELIEEKAKATDGQFVDMLKIFNALFAKNYNKIPNQILLESLLYNVPTKLFCKDDIYRTFVNVSNYLRISNPKNFVSICKGERSVFEEPLVIKSNSQVDFGRIVTMLDNYKY